MSQPRLPLALVDPNSTRRKELNPTLRASLCAASDFGGSSAEIAAHYNVPETTVKGVIHRAPQQAAYTSKPRSGRPRKFIRRDEHTLLRYARRDPKQTYAQLKQASSLTLSKSTLYRILKSYRITNWIVQKRPKLTEEHARLRLAFTQKYVRLTAQEWL